MFRSLFSGKTPGRSCLMMQIHNLYFNPKGFIFYFWLKLQKVSFFGPKELFSWNFRFRRLLQAGRVNYPLLNKMPGNGLKNGSIEKGVATTCYNPRFITFLWLRTQPPIFGLPGSCLQRQFPGSLSFGFSKGTPKSVYIAPFPLLTDYPGLYASR